MKDKTLGMFWFGFGATLLGIFVYLLWRRQHEQPLQAPGVVTIGTPPVTNLAAPPNSMDAASALVRNVAEVVASTADRVEHKPFHREAGKRDDLQQIKGIGKVYAARLNAAGIHTFADVARQSPERLAEIVALKAWQAADPINWINQADELAAG